MLWDTHLHTKFSGDSTSNPRDMVESAMKKGLSGICFTDHQDLEYSATPGLFDLDFPTYQKEILLLKEEYKNKFPICWGVELGVQPDTVKGNIKIASTYPFDFIIASSHEINHKDLYYSDFYVGREELDCYRQYFEAILENLHTDIDFDVYGHLDYVVRYGPNKNKYYSYEKFADIIDAILLRIIEKGKGIELNTAGFKYGLGHPNPTERIIERYRELGGEIITIGSDGHTPEQIAWDFQKVPDILKNAGFNYFTVFKDRKPNFIKIN